MSQWSEVDEFLSRSDVDNAIWFIGGSDFTDAAERVDDAMQMFADENIGVVTGGTDDGLPRIAAKKAKEYDIPTLGIYPQKAEEKGYVLEEFNDYGFCAEPRARGSSWGDESEVGAKIVDGVLMFEGGHGTRVEYHSSQKDDPAYVVAMEGTGGAADKLNNDEDYLTSEHTPEEPISSGEEAAKFVLNNLKGENYDIETSTAEV